MRSEQAGRFVARGALVALTAGVLVAAATVATGAEPRWAGLGWALACLLGLAGGAWLAALHGTPGSAFLVALGVGLLARLGVLTLAAVAAALAGNSAIGSYGLGLGFGFVAMLAYEAAWFVLADRRQRWNGGTLGG